MDLNSPVAVAFIAAVVSVLGTLLTVRAAVRTSRNSVVQAHNAVVQAQVQEIIKKRIEFYPAFWKIPVRYETNWTLTHQDKTREWAEQYARDLNEFNLEGGVFFSQAVYEKFVELRELLHEAIDETLPGAEVPRGLTDRIRRVFYGDRIYGPGLSTVLKDDLGSYQNALLARRSDR